MELVYAKDNGHAITRNIFSCLVCLLLNIFSSVISALKIPILERNKLNRHSCEHVPSIA